MFTPTVYIRGAAKPVGIQKPKRPKCTLTAVRRTLAALNRIQISWFEPPLRLIYDMLKAVVNNKVKPNILLSHKIIWEKVKQLLQCHLQHNFRPLINLLRQKTIQYQLSTMWIHITYFHTTPDALKPLLTSAAYDACWICNRLHFPLDCATTHLQAKWKAMRAGEYFVFQTPRNMKKLYDLQLQPLRYNPWQQLCEFSHKHDIELEPSLQNPHFLNQIIVSLRRHSAKPFCRIWDCLNFTNIARQLETFFTCHQREDNLEQIEQSIRSNKTQTCEVCKQVGHCARRCLQTKIAFQNRCLT